MVELLRSIVDSLEISPSGQIIFRNRPLFNFMELGHRNEAKDEALLQRQLSGLLYEQFYCAGGVPEPENRNFLRELKKNNLSRSRIRKGYTLEIAQELPYVACKRDHRLKLHPGSYLLPGGKNAGDEAWVYLPKENIKGIFYYAFSHAPATFFHESTLRFYFNTDAEGSILLMNYFTGSLNKARVPFVLKCICEPQHMHRSDSFILYTDYRFVNATYTLIREMPETLTSHFYPKPPLFTLALQPGTGFAESPHDPRKSFGMARCELLAEALTATRENCGDRLEAVITCIENKGYTLQRFFLNPGSKLIYPFL